MRDLAPPSDPTGSLLVALAFGTVAAGSSVAGLFWIIWPLGEFGSFGLHWPYFKDGIASYFKLVGTGSVWESYLASMEAGGHLPGLILRLAGIGTVGLAAGLWAGFAAYGKTLPKPVHVRGLTYLKDVKVAARAARQQSTRELARRRGRGVWIHPRIQLTAERENRGILVSGSVGSGKTQFLWPMIKEAAASPHRTIIFDHKGDFTAGLPLSDDEIILLAPWDARSCHWHIARDIQTRADARLLAEVLIQDSPHDPMWGNAARQVFTGLVTYLCETRPSTWTFAELAGLIAADDETIARAAIHGNPNCRRVMENLVNEGKTAQSVLINTSAFLEPILDMAHAWSDQKGGFSIQRFLADDYNGPTTLILQGSSVYGAFVRGLHNAFLSLTASRIDDASFPEARSRPEDYRIYCFLDEFTHLGRLSCLEGLITAGRSKGVRMIIGFQDIAQVRALYGREVATAWMAQLSTQVYCRVPPGDTANWISETIGQREIDRPVRSLQHGDGREGAAESIGWNTTPEKLIYPAELATDLDADDRQFTALLYCSGWPAIYRLEWPVVRPGMLRSPVVPADWTKPRAAVSTPSVSPAGAGTSGSGPGAASESVEAAVSTGKRRFARRSKSGGTGDEAPRVPAFGPEAKIQPPDQTGGKAATTSAAIEGAPDLFTNLSENPASIETDNASEGKAVRKQNSNDELDQMAMEFYQDHRAQSR